MSEKLITSLLLIAGVAAVAYGMLTKNNYVFIAGIIMVVAGYCQIRKGLKRWIDEKHGSEGRDINGQDEKK